jgi:hypothetical protein
VKSAETAPFRPGVVGHRNSGREAGRDDGGIDEEGSMTEGSMTGRPYGGTNERSDDDVLPGERPEHGEVGPPSPAEEPRAAQGPMSEDVTRVPDGGAAPGSDAKRPGMPDATGPTG